MKTRAAIRLSPLTLLLPVATVFLLASVLGCGLLERFEHPESHYDTFEEAVDSGALGKGRFIPELLPTSSLDIHATHDIDINESWVAFRYTPGDSGSIRSACSPCDSRKVRYARQHWSRKIEWWPSWLVEGPREGAPPGYSTFSCPRAVVYSGGRSTRYTAYVAINDTEGQGYFWHGSI